jgi:hypothetical protein
MILAGLIICAVAFYHLFCKNAPIADQDSDEFKKNQEL